jgi:hypothetical protein
MGYRLLRRYDGAILYGERFSDLRGFQTWAPADGHTLADRPHLTAVKVIEHHNYVWSDLIAPGGPVRIATCEQLMSKSAR